MTIVETTPTRQWTRYWYGDDALNVTTDHEGVPWFLAGDVTRMLGYGRTPDMLRLVEARDRWTLKLPTAGNEQDCVLISEPALYRVILRSNRPNAQTFADWVTRDVLPRIRATGTYTNGKQVAAALDRAALAQMVLDAEKELAAARDRADRATATVAAITPAAGVWDHCSGVKDSWLVTPSARNMLRRDPALTAKLAGPDGTNALYVAMFQIGFTNHGGAVNGRSVWIPNPTAAAKDLIRVDDDGKRLRITRRGLPLLHQHLGGSAPLDMDTPLDGDE
jgi:anti-repressor protein